MAHYTGSATSQDDLLDKVSTHAALHGWTCTDDGSIWNFEKEGFKCTAEPNAATSTGHTSIKFKASSTVSLPYNLGVVAAQGADYAGLGEIPNTITGFVSYHVFITTVGEPRIHIAAEFTSQVWRHVMFGVLTKIGTWEGGAFAISNYTNKNYYDSWDSDAYLGKMFSCSSTLEERKNHMSWYTDSATYEWAHCVNSNSYGSQKYYQVGPQGYGFGVNGAGSFDDQFLHLAQPNAGTGEHYMAAPEFFITRSGNLRCLAGSLDEIRSVNMQGILDAQTVTIGADDWMFFPELKNGYPEDTGSDYSSGYFGIALRV